MRSIRRKYKQTTTNMKGKEMEEDRQIRIVDKAADKAVKQLERERKDEERSCIVDWFRYAELVSNQLRKHLN